MKNCLSYLFCIQAILFLFTFNAFSADNAIYVGIARQNGLYNQLDVVSNNVANANTAGFKEKNVLFNEYEHKNKKYGKRKLSYGQDLASVNNFKAGTLKATQRPLDVAINGDGFFVVDATFGTAYTRSGNFYLSASNALVTADGYTVQGLGGSITFGEEDSQLQVSDEGVITSLVDGIWESRGQLRVVKFENLYNMEMVGGTLFTNSKEVPEEALFFEDFSIAQGMLEESNVNAISKVSEMMNVTRRATSVAGFVNDNHKMQINSINTILGN
jgi:flagellar basal-body rod protein FlgF